LQVKDENKQHVPTQIYKTLQNSVHKAAESPLRRSHKPAHACSSSPLHKYHMCAIFLRPVHSVGAVEAFLSVLAIVEMLPDLGPDAERGLRIAIVVPAAGVETGRMGARERLLLQHLTKSLPARCHE
jgi:hypothetical protein